MTEPSRTRPDGTKPSEERLEAIVRGRVQGVGFRWFVERQAHALGLTGWVANRPDRSVQVVAEGPTGALERLIEALGRGPSGARVTAVDQQRMPPTGSFTRFAIRSGAHPGD